jgi:diguanylate cyclase (GGDEF)-like protein
MPSWSDHFIPVALRADDAVLRRARLTVQLSAVLIGAAAAYAVFYTTVVEFPAGARILGVGTGVAAILLASLRVGASLRVVNHVLTALLYAVLVALAANEGGLSSLITPWLITPPIFGVLLLGRRGAAAWTVLCVLTIVAFHVAELQGVRFPVGYPDEWAARITLGSHAGLVVCTAILLFVFEDIRARAHARAESASAALARLAYHDALTGLPNRARFLECLDGALARAHAADDPTRVAVLMLDLDGFKGVNDSMGHAAGDHLLVQVAARLLSATRGCDTVARLGGDEFAVVLDGVHHDDDAQVVAQRVVAAIAAPFALDGRQVQVGASLGIARATAVPDGGTTSTGAMAVASIGAAARAPRGAAASVLHEADLAMYHAKALGRGRWVQFEPGMLTPAPPPASPPERRTAIAQPRLGVA